MAKREISIFSISFLDLLSGALAAVIILFVIVPKMSAEESDAIETLERLEVEVKELEDLIEQARNSIPEELYEQIQEQVNQLNETIEDLNEQHEQMSEQLDECREAREELERQLEETQQQLDEALEKMETMSERTVDQSTASGQAMYGVDSKFSIVISWPDDLDVDLHIVNRNNNEKVWWDDLNSSWGNLLNDVRTKPRDEDIFELFYQKQIVPGTYDIYYHLYSNVSQSVTVKGYIVIFPFNPNEYRYDLPVQTIRHQQKPVKIGTVLLQSDRFQFQN